MPDSPTMTDTLDASEKPASGDGREGRDVGFDMQAKRSSVFRDFLLLCRKEK